MDKLKLRLLTLILFVKYIKQCDTFDDSYTLRKECKKQAEGYLLK
jgi:hypothetical protein